MVSKAFLPLQIFIYFERIYIVIFFLFEIIMYIFKALVLVYPRGYLGSEIAGLFFLLILQYIKLENANTANKTEIKAYHVYTIFYSIPVILGYGFYLYHQIYVLIFDFWISIFGLFFAGMELIFSIITIFMINREK